MAKRPLTSRVAAIKRGLAGLNRRSKQGTREVPVVITITGTAGVSPSNDTAAASVEIMIRGALAKHFKNLRVQVTETKGGGTTDRDCESDA